MARKETITMQDILDTAFLMTREEGFENVTARRVAAKAGCSTQPIFRVYKNMEELWQAVYDRAVDYFQEYISRREQTNPVPFVDLGLSYISFAVEETHLFYLLFASGAKKTGKKKEMYEIMNGSAGNVVREISRAVEMGCKGAESLFIKMWLFIHGAACMSLIGEFDLSGEEAAKLLAEAYYAFAE